MLKVKHALLALSLAFIVGINAAACSGDSSTKTVDGSSNASQSSVDALTSRVQMNDMRDAAVTIAAMPLHDYDTSAQNGTIDGKYLPTARLLVRTLALTDWSPEIKAEAQKFHDEATALLKALEAGDPEAVKAPSAVVHEHVHTFPNDIWAIVAKDLPSDAGGPVPTSSSNMTPASPATAHP